MIFGRIFIGIVAVFLWVWAVTGLNIKDLLGINYARVFVSARGENQSGVERSIQAVYLIKGNYQISDIVNKINAEEKLKTIEILTIGKI